MPPHKGHYAVYKWLVEQFGPNDVYIATSNRTDNIKSPFSFVDKKFLWETGFGVPSGKIVFSAIPAFNPMEVLEPNDVYVAVTSVKDGDRYTKSDYYKPYPLKDGVPVPFEEVKNLLKTKTHCGYYVVCPTMENGISGTQVREKFRQENNHGRKKIIKTLYGTVDKDILKLFEDRLIKASKKP